MHSPIAGEYRQPDKLRAAMRREGARPASKRSRLRSLITLSGLLGFALIAAGGGDVTAAQTVPAPAPFTFNFTGEPAAPQPWTPSNWDVVVESRDKGSFAHLEGMQAQHGPDCAPSPATHFNNTYEGAVFLCHNHVMTAITAHGYGEIVLTPDHMVDISGGTAQVQYSVSTFRASARDWYEVWFTPFSENLVLPIDAFQHVDLQGPPKEAFSIRLDTFNGSVFRAQEFANYVPTKIPGNSWTSLESLLPPSPVARTKFEVDFSSTHLRFGIPALPNGRPFWFVDHDFPYRLSSTQYLVQISHYSYNPTKDCTPNTQHCLPNTWHWSNFSISTAVPFTLLRGDAQVVNAGTSGVVNFPAPAPGSAFLRFAAIGSIDVSLDGGKTWQPARRQAQMFNVQEHFASYWMPVPAGTKSVNLRGHNFAVGPWYIRDVAIWSNGIPAATQPGTQQPPSGSKPGAAHPAANMGLAAWLGRPEVKAAGIAMVAIAVIVGLGYLILIRWRRMRLRRR